VPVATIATPMAVSVHDNVLVSYEVQCEGRRIVLHTEFREVKPPERVDVVFVGVEGYHFEDDAFGNIVFGVETVPLEDLVARHRTEIEAAHRNTGWPWAADLEAAPGLLRAMGVRGFELSASLGLSGWVLARTAVIVPEARPVEAPAGEAERGLYALERDGRRTKLDATGVVIDFGDGRRLLVDRAAPAATDGVVVLQSDYEGPEGSSAIQLGERRLPETCAFIVVHPAGANWMHAGVTAHRRIDGATLAPSAASPPPRKSYRLARGDGAEVGTDAKNFLFDLGRGRVLQIEPLWHKSVPDRASFLAGPPPTRTDAPERRSYVSSDLTVRFGGGNDVRLEVSPPHELRPIIRPPPRPSGA
jgi:hypothetical protein